jgi:hypothetical protein
MVRYKLGSRQAHDHDLGRTCRVRTHLDHCENSGGADQGSSPRRALRSEAHTHPASTDRSPSSPCRWRSLRRDRSDVQRKSQHDLSLGPMSEAGRPRGERNPGRPFPRQRDCKRWGGEQKSERVPGNNRKNPSPPAPLRRVNTAPPQRCTIPPKAQHSPTGRLARRGSLRPRSAFPWFESYQAASASL